MVARFLEYFHLKQMKRTQMKNHQSLLSSALIAFAALFLAVHPTFGQLAADTSHPSDPYFALDRVLDVSIEIAP